MMMTNPHPTNLELGYTLYPPRRPQEPGYPRLDIILRSTPTGQHFDPLRVHLDVATSDHDVTCLAFEHPWSDLDDYTVCAGIVDLIDHKGKHLDAFTFGGALHIQNEEEHTLLVLTSPAPILLPAESRLDQLLVDEVKIVLAERQAVREVEPGLFDKHLIAAPPLELYHAISVAVLERYHRLHSSDDELILKLQHTLRVEIEAIAGQLSIMNRRPIDKLL
jgi:hypothetical protein